MGRINVCPACNALQHGVKSRIAFEHTCGLETGAVPELTDESVLTFGAHKGKALANVPAYYLLWILDNFRDWHRQPGLKKYIQANEKLLLEEKRKEEEKRFNKNNK